MAVASDSTITPIIPFPSDRAREPNPLHRAIDDWELTRNVELAATVFCSTPADAIAMVRSTILEGGSGAVTKMLEEIAQAIGTLRGAVAELIAADQMIAAAADRVLAEAGA